MSIEWPGLRRATLSGRAVVGGRAAGGPLPARGEPGPRATGAEPRAQLLWGRRPKGERVVLMGEEGSLRTQPLGRAALAAARTSPPSAVLPAPPFIGQRPEAQTWCGQWLTPGAGGGRPPRRGVLTPSLCPQQLAAPLACCPPTQPGGGLRGTGEGGSACCRL